MTDATIGFGLSLLCLLAAVFGSRLNRLSPGGLPAKLVARLPEAALVTLVVGLIRLAFLRHRLPPAWPDEAMLALAGLALLPGLFLRAKLPRALFRLALAMIALLPAWAIGFSLLFPAPPGPEPLWFFSLPGYWLALIGLAAWGWLLITAAGLYLPALLKKFPGAVALSLEPAQIEPVRAKLALLATIALPAGVALLALQNGLVRGTLAPVTGWTVLLLALAAIRWLEFAAPRHYRAEAILSALALGGALINLIVITG